MAYSFAAGSKHYKTKSLRSPTSVDKPLILSDMLGFVIPHDRTIRKFRHQSPHPPQQILRSKKGPWSDKRRSAEDFFKSPPTYCKNENAKRRSVHSPKNRIREGDIKNLTPKFQDIRISSPWPPRAPSRSWYRKTNKKRNRVTCNNIVRVIKPVCIKNNREEMEIYYEKLKG